MVEIGIQCRVLFCGSKNNVCLVFTARQDSRLVHLKCFKQVLKSNVSTGDGGQCKCADAAGRPLTSKLPFPQLVHTFREKSTQHWSQLLNIVEWASGAGAKDLSREVQHEVGMAVSRPLRAGRVRTFRRWPRRYAYWILESGG